MSKTYTKGNVIVEEINIGDIHYEYEYGLGIKCQVVSKPIMNDEGNWEWISINENTDEKIEYFVNPEYSHYGPNLYDYKAYKVKQYI